MSDIFDPNLIAAEFLNKNLERLYDGTKGLLRGAKDKILLLLESTYRSYITDLLNKYGNTKSFFLRGSPTPLYDFYVPIDIQVDANITIKPEIELIINNASSTIIVGSAGCGKSMLLKHLLVDCLENHPLIPVFIELRRFNSFDGDLFELIVKTMHLYKFSLDGEYIEKALVSGHYILFLDGYDEVVTSKRVNVRDWIHEFIRKYDANYVVMSSRPDPELEGWQLFSMAQVCPLSLEQACSLIGKLPYDEEIKAKFLLELENVLFEKHNSFLSNPLLLSIMLLSYGQSATIPNKLSLFYNQAYEALFERHDALKDGFRREILCGLDIHDFGRIFSAFNIQAYDERLFEFTRTQALKIIESSTKLLSIICDRDKFLSDLTLATSLLIQDGLLLTYAHRSFQEYFAARFICEQKSDIQKQLIGKYSNYLGLDNMLSMLHEMRPEVVEEFLLIPWLDSLYNLYGSDVAVNKEMFIALLGDLLDCIAVDNGGNIMLVVTDNGLEFMHNYQFIVKRYGDRSMQHKLDDKERAQYKKHADKIIYKHGLVADHDMKVTPELLGDLAEFELIFPRKIIRELFIIRERIKEKINVGGRTLGRILKLEE